MYSDSFHNFRLRSKKKDEYTENSTEFRYTHSDISAVKMGYPYRNMICRKYEHKCSTQNWPFVEVRSSLREGSGLFLKQDILPHTVVCNYGGKVVSDIEARSSLLPFTDRCSYLLEFIEIKTNAKRETIYLNHDETTDFTYGKYLNHSQLHPNTNYKVVIRWNGHPDVLFVSSRYIKKGEQLTWDYGPNFSGVQKCVESCLLCRNK